MKNKKYIALADDFFKTNDVSVSRARGLIISILYPVLNIIGRIIES